jgi:hypothetical protein
MSSILALCPSLLLRRPRIALLAEGAATTAQAASREQSTAQQQTTRTATPWKDERRRMALTFGCNNTWGVLSHHCATGASGRASLARMEESSVACSSGATCLGSLPLLR